MTTTHIIEAGIILSVAGLLIGFLSGLLGKGGGMLLVPTFWYIFPFLGIPENLIPKAAVATSLACMSVTSSTSLYYHIKRGFFKKDLFIYLISGALPGVLLGTFLTAKIIPAHITKILFALFLIYMSIKMIRGNKKIDENKKKKYTFNSIFIVGFFSGLIAGLLGIGGGAVITPSLYSFANIPIKNAMATTTGVVFFNSITSTINYIFYGLNKIDYPYFLGYIYYPAVIFMVPFLFIGTKFGVSFMHKTNPEKLRKIFAIFLIIVAINAVIKTLK